jgi:transposase-like protein
MTRRRNSERERYWRGLIGEQRSSGVSISAFCRERETPLSSFFQWRRKLEQRQHEQGSAQGESASREGGDRNSPGEHAPSVVQFVPVTLDAPPPAKRIGCEVVLPDGCRLLVSTGCDANWLREIVEALQGAASC